MTYDARKDADKLSLPLRNWAKLGFLRGFAGMRTDLGPKGPLVLPSAAFHEAAKDGLLNPPPKDQADEAARREYVDEVETALRDVQADVIRDHYRKAFHGWAVDLAMGWVTVIIAAICWYYLTIWHPVTVSVLILMSLKTFALHILFRRTIKRSMAVFASSSDDITLPWQEVTVGKVN